MVRGRLLASASSRKAQIMHADRNEGFPECLFIEPEASAALRGMTLFGTCAVLTISIARIA